MHLIETTRKRTTPLHDSIYQDSHEIRAKQGNNLYLNQLSKTTQQLKKKLKMLQQGFAASISLQCRVEEMLSTADQLLSELVHVTNDWAFVIAALANGKHHGTTTRTPNSE